MKTTEAEAAPKHDARLGLRLSREHKDKIEKAALISGQNVSDFITTTALRSALEILDRHAQTVLSDRDRDIFLALMDAADEPNDALKAAAAEYKTGRVEGTRYHW